MTPTTPPAVSEATREAVAREYVLVKRGLYYRPQAMGYTGVLDDAGRYPEAEAMGHVDHASGVTAILASEAPRFSDACWPETITKTLEADLAKAASEIARLTGERDEAVKSLNACIADMERGGTCKRIYSDAALGRELEAAETKVTTLTGERDAARNDLDEAVMALEAKVAALALHGTCACSYDKPGDVCSHHSPALAAAEADLTRMRAETERLEAERDELIGALEDTRAAADDLVPVCLVEGDNKAAGALQFVSGFISDRLAALSNPEQTDGR